MVHRESRILAALGCWLVVCLLLMTLPAARAQSSADADLDRIKRATVFIYQALNTQAGLSVTCVSSGTLISADGLIVTNAHGVAPSQQCAGDTLIVSLNVDLNEPPIPKFRAEIAGLDQGLDIALLRVTQELDGRLIASGALPALPFVAIGDANAVSIDDNVTVLGYRDLDNSPVSVSRGTVTAFVAEPVGRSRAWFKTRAEIPGTMAGGGAYNSAGELIGIPTNAPLVSAGSAASNCRYIVDSNGDGLLNSSDRCVPIGDFISTIRPIHLAASLIRAARLGLFVENLPPPPSAAALPSAPRVSRLFFAPSTLDDRLPSTVVGSLPANTRSLYLFFDYENMTPETVYELRVARDGIPDTVFSLPPVRWSGGASGMWHIGGREQAWANGAYEFSLLINGISAGSQQIVIGGGAGDSAYFSDIVFGSLDSGGSLVGNGAIVPLGSIASARFLYANMPAGADWAAIWYFDGGEVARSSDTWSDDAHGAKTISLAPSGGLLPGQYRLELYIEGALSATSDFVVAGRPGSPLPAIFQNLRLATAESAGAAQRAAAASSFPSGIATLYALFDWNSIAPGTPWTLRWLVDDQAFFQRTQPWLHTTSGEALNLALAAPPDGKYTLQLLINNLQLAETEASIGIGQLPIDRFAEAEGALLTGAVIDAATQTGIPSVTIVLISEDFAASEFEWKQEQLFDYATTDRNGDFQFGRPLAFDTPYSIVVEADGYLPLAADEFMFEATVPYADIRIELVRG